MSLAGVVESGYGRELVELLPQLTRADYRKLQAHGTWDREVVLAGEVKFWRGVLREGLRHATPVRVMQP